jgi:hypothetical protein
MSLAQNGSTLEGIAGQPRQVHPLESPNMLGHLAPQPTPRQCLRIGLGAHRLRMARVISSPGMVNSCPICKRTEKFNGLLIGVFSSNHRQTTEGNSARSQLLERLSSCIRVR